MPQMQVFFVAMPLQIGLGLGMLFIVLPVTIRWFIGGFEDAILPFIAL